MQQQIISIVQKSIQTKQAVLHDTAILKSIEAIVQLLIGSLNSGGTLYFCGNGGSAADAQHLAAEFTGRFYKERSALRAEALHCNTSYLTAVANDYGYDMVYERLIAGIGKSNDVLIALSTSGHSANINRAVAAAAAIGMPVVGLTGRDGGTMAPQCTHSIIVPSQDTPRIQEAHILIGHIICELVEQELFA